MHASSPPPRPSTRRRCWAVRRGGSSSSRQAPTTRRPPRTRRPASIRCTSPPSSARRWARARGWGLRARQTLKRVAPTLGGWTRRRGCGMRCGCDGASGGRQDALRPTTAWAPSACAARARRGSRTTGAGARRARRASSRASAARARASRAPRALCKGARRAGPWRSGSARAQRASRAWRWRWRCRCSLRRLGRGLTSFRSCPARASPPAPPRACAPISPSSARPRTCGTSCRRGTTARCGGRGKCRCALTAGSGSAPTRRSALSTPTAAMMPRGAAGGRRGTAC
mmetsp:Transcript_42630/g.100133  ORF Transcript_42630/g.100133 Transcript_42630/m.100133 type:complete len:285 (+) Transcript_42630:178-1032(+)